MLLYRRGCWTFVHGWDGWYGGEASHRDGSENDEAQAGPRTDAGGMGRALRSGGPA